MTSFMTSRPRSGNLKRAIVAALDKMAVIISRELEEDPHLTSHDLSQLQSFAKCSSQNMNR